MNYKQYSQQLEEACKEFDSTGHNVKYENITHSYLSQVALKHSVEKETLMNIKTKKATFHNMTFTDDYNLILILPTTNIAELFKYSNFFDLADPTMQNIFNNYYLCCCKYMYILTVWL